MINKNQRCKMATFVKVIKISTTSTITINILVFLIDLNQVINLQILFLFIMYGFLVIFISIQIVFP